VPRKKKDRKSHTITGVIQTTRGGLGFIRQEKEDIRIESGDLNTALNGDTVKVALSGHAKGKVVGVLERAKSKFVGVVEIENNSYFVVPDDKRTYADFLIPKDPDLKSNDKVLVEFVEWTDPKKNPVGRVVRRLGAKGEHEVEIQSIVLEHNIDTSFPDSVASEAKNIARKWKKDAENYIAQDVASGKRRDFRNTPTFTIDPVDAKDFDDALSVRSLPNGDIEVGIHIADVSHYVRPNSALDTEAQTRGFSVYLVDRTIPMLPEELSNDICSLNPHVPRLTFSAVFVIDKSSRVKERWLGKGVIHSDKRFTYEEAQRVLDGSSKDKKYLSNLEILNEHALALSKRRFEEGAIDFDQSEVEVEIDSKGTPTRIYRKERLATHRLVEEWMLLANREVAQKIWKLHGKKPLARGFLYRVHDLPDKEKLEEITTFVRALGYSFGKGKSKRITAQDINRLFKEIEGSPVEGLIKTAMIRTMAKAAYTTRNIGHFGLGFKDYTHFTSPIRRYPDLVVHRLLYEHLHGKEIADKDIESYHKLGQTLSAKEIEVQKAERESTQYKQVEYMSARVGEKFTGIITGVTDWGLYVEDLDTGSEGLVRISDLGDDYYKVDHKKYRMVGQKTQKVYSLGDRVQFKVVGANIDRKTLDYAII